jgi:hypothetical protein
MSRESDTKIRLAILGVSVHVQEIYITSLERPDIRDLIDVTWVADLADKSVVLQRCAEAGQPPLFVDVLTEGYDETS